MKRLFWIPFCLLLLLSSGCDALLSGRYHTVSAHGTQSARGDADIAQRVSNYEELKEIIWRMVRNGEEKGEIRFYDYSGDEVNDGFLACQEILREPLGAYLVDYFSPDFVKKLTYIELSLSIAYHPDHEAPTSVTGDKGLRMVLEQALAAHEAHLVYDVAAFSLSETELERMILSFYLSQPERAVCRPRVTVALYPDTPDAGSRRIVDIRLVYGLKREVLEERVKIARGKLDGLLEGKPEGLPPDETALWLHDRLIGALAYDAELSEENPAGDNLYTALTGGRAGSEGFALCYAALCGRAGLDARLVAGKRKSGPAAWHPVTWNQVNVDGVWYHADVAADAEASAETAERPARLWFLKSDMQMFETTRWDTADAEECNTEYDLPAIPGALTGNS